MSTFIGWAEHPHYDKKNHKLYWAKEIKFGDSKENTLNYNIRILGRKGVLVLNAVAVKSQLQEVSQKAELLLPQIDFNPGLASAGFDVNDWNSNRTCFQITKTYTQQEAIAYQGVWSDHEYAQSYFEAIAPCATALNLWYDDLRKTHGK